MAPPPGGVLCRRKNINMKKEERARQTERAGRLKAATNSDRPCSFAFRGSVGADGCLRRSIPGVSLGEEASKGQSLACRV